MLKALLKVLKEYSFSYKCSYFKERKSGVQVIEINRFKEKTEKYKICLSEKQLKQFEKYADLLIEWNKKINLTAIVEAEDIENKHYIDSLLLAIQPEVIGKLVDVGSGAGFPGMVCKIYKPDVDVTLMEPTGKRVVFLEKINEELQLGVHCVKERAEEAARKKWREIFDVATARAVAPLPVLCEYCLPLVKPGGVFLAMKGEAEREVEEASKAIHKLGGEFCEIRNFTLPDGSVRSIVVIRKIENTDKVYPRNGARIVKKPL